MTFFAVRLFGLAAVLCMGQQRTGEEVCLLQTAFMQRQELGRDGEPTDDEADEAEKPKKKKKEKKEKKEKQDDDDDDEPKKQKKKKGGEDDDEKPATTESPQETPQPFSVGIFGHPKQDSDSEPAIGSMRLADYNAGGTNFQQAIEQMANTHTGARPEPCCGSLGNLVEEADAGSCVKVGASDLNALIHNRDASDTFGDNVGIDKYEYFLEDCTSASGECSYTEITDPDVDGHIFKVGITNIKVRATDLSDNTYECMRTIYLYDKQPPSFSDPDFEPMHPDNAPDDLVVEVPADACIVQNEAGFVRHSDLGFQTAAVDNCDVAGMSHFGLRASDPAGVHLRKLIYSYDPDAGIGSSAATLLYDSDDVSTSPTSTSAGLMPGTYHMKYMLIDDFSTPFDFPAGGDKKEWHQFNHSVLLTVKDETPPTAIDQCPENINIEIEPTEMSAVVNWTVPKVSEDNCLVDDMEQPPPAVEFEGKTPGMTMEVGAHIVKYSFHDAHGNAYPEECSFEVRIVHKNHPVNVTCPELDVFDTLLNSDFAIVTWDTPVVLQNGQILDSSHITYEPSVAPGMPFPFGETTIKVIAKGQNYVAVQEGHQDLEMDECYFKVQVGDPQSPKCDGRQYRCAAGASGTKPFGICDGPELEISFHDDFDVTHVYETTGVTELVSEDCCTSEEDVQHQCSVISGTGSKQCKPVSR
jgi:hypothetical protein